MEPESSTQTNGHRAIANFGPAYYVILLQKSYAMSKQSIKFATLTALIECPQTIVFPYVNNGDTFSYYNIVTF